MQFNGAVMPNAKPTALQPQTELVTSQTAYCIHCNTIQRALIMVYKHHFYKYSTQYAV